MSVVVVTPPGQLVSLELAKQHLRIDHDDDDQLIELYLAAAQAMIDGPGGWLGRCVGVQELELRFDGFVTPIWGWNYDSGGLFWGASPDYYSVFNAAWPAGRVRLPFPPLVSVTSVTYEDQDGQMQELPSANYLATDEGLDAAFGTTFPSGRWEANAVRVRYQAGYPTPPSSIVAAILLMIGDLYDNRATVETGVRAAAVMIPMSTTVEALLSPFRVFN